MAPHSLSMVRRIKAPPARVFQAFTRPQDILRWYGPDAGPVLSAELDVRVGGGFRISFRTEDGQTHTTVGTYRTLEPPHLLVYSMQWIQFPERESVVTIRLAAIAEGTELTLLHEPFVDEGSRDAHAEGWTGALEHLRALAESPPEPAA